VCLADKNEVSAISADGRANINDDLSQKLQIIIYYSNKSPTRCNNFPVYYPDVHLQFNMFLAFPRPLSGA
jgi:hypothetical protein